MRIAIDAREMVGQIAGKGRYVAELVRALAKIDQKNTYLLYVKAPSNIPLPSNFKIVLIGGLPGLRQLWLAQNAAQEKCNLLFAPTGYLPVVFSFLPCVTTVHDLAVFVSKKTKPALKTLIAEKLLLGLAVSKSNQLITVSQSTKNDLEAIFPSAKNKISVTLLGYDRQAYTPEVKKEDKEILQKYRLSPGYLLFIGTLEPRKNIEGIIRAYAALPSAMRSLHPLVIGGQKGWYYDSIFTTVKELNLGEEILFLGRVADSDLPSLYRHAKLFLFPSFYEGFGLPPLEAMACGTPVVTSNISSLPEVVGEGGLLVDPNSSAAITRAVQSLIGNQKVYENCQKQALTQAATFSWEKTAKETLLIWQKCATASRSANGAKADKKKKSLKITFILPFANLTGGIKILLEHADRLAGLGHKVTIIYPGVLFHGKNFETVNNTLVWRFLAAPMRQLKYTLMQLLGRSEANWFPFKNKVGIRRTPDLSARYMPEGDIVIATAPETVSYVAAYPREKGKQVHFSQDYEAWYLPDEFLAHIYTHDKMHLITIGSWQKKLYEERFKRTVEAVIPNGVDLTRFKPTTLKPNREKIAPKSGTGEKATRPVADQPIADQPIADRPVRVLMSYHHAPYKGVADGLTAVDRVRKAGYAVQVVMFGVHKLKSEMPREVEYHYQVPEEELPEVYRSCDIFLWPTHREGFGLPPLEAMACGIPVVGTDAGAMNDFMQEGKTGYIVPIKQPEKLAEKLELLIKDSALRLKLARQAAEQATRWSWDEQTLKLERYLLKLMP